MTSDLKQDCYTIICSFLSRFCPVFIFLSFWHVFICMILESACCRELGNLGFIAHKFRQAQHIHITHILVSELVRLISCETVLCSLHNLNVTNNDFEHARYALPHYTLP